MPPPFLWSKRGGCPIIGKADALPWSHPQMFNMDTAVISLQS
jgi:hypothetical protein